MLGKAEAFYLLLSKIPNLNDRISVHEMGFRWPRDADEVAVRLKTFTNACAEFTAEGNVSRLKKLLSMILCTGNYLNGGTPRGKAYGVKLEVLKKISNLKANETNRGSLMHYIAHEAYVHHP